MVSPTRLFVWIGEPVLHFLAVVGYKVGPVGEHRVASLAAEIEVRCRRFVDGVEDVVAVITVEDVFGAATLFAIAELVGSVAAVHYVRTVSTVQFVVSSITKEGVRLFTTKVVY